jgi:cytochrome P450
MSDQPQTPPTHDQPPTEQAGTPDPLPPGPRMPALLQTLGMWSRPTSFVENARRRYGTPFTVRMIGQPPMVMIADPEEIKQVFMAPPDVLHPGEGARILEPVVGPNSVILLDEAPHLEQRKLMLPAFHGEKMQSLSGLMEELTERELADWPTGAPTPLHPRLQRLTLEIILRAVFGLEQGARLDSLRDLLTRILAFGESPLSLLPPPPRFLWRFGPARDLDRATRQADELIYALIEERRAHGEDQGEDVLSMLLGAAHEDGSPMSAQEIRDELMTALVAGHETTASQLAWTFERLAREPAVLERLQAEIDAGEQDEYLTATIHEVMRLRPVIPNAEPRLVKRPTRIGARTYPAGVSLFAAAYLMQHDPDIYPDPYAFKPERFLGTTPGTYTWIPFGGGRRRCLGASFATLEMKIVLRAALSRFALTGTGRERIRRRSITLSPARGCTVVLTPRAPMPVSAAGTERTAAFA